MATKGNQALIDSLKKLAASITEIAAVLGGPDEQTAPVRTYSYEEVRGILAEKSRTGFRAEVKSILTAHGVKQLSDVKDPDELAAIVKEAEVIGNG